MLQFVQPIWLLAMSGILVPLAVHLWNKREARILQVGSVRLLESRVANRARRLHLSEWLLLLLRCLIITLLALLLARPQWRSTEGLQKNNGWIVVEQEALKAARSQYGPLMDSLSTAGYETHLFQEGFPRIGEAVTQVGDSISTWRLLRLLEVARPGAQPVQLFTRGLLREFVGPRPELSLDIRYHPVSTANPALETVAAAYLTASDSIRRITVSTAAEAMRFLAETIAPTPAGVEVRSGAPFLRTQRGALQAIDTSTRQVAIYAAANADDAKYLAAVLAAIRQYTQHRIAVVQYHDDTDSIAPADWVFWLSPRPLPASGTAPVTFRYVPGAPVPLSSWIECGQGEPQIDLYKIIRDNVTDPKALMTWTDGYGQPLLTTVSDSGQLCFNFYSRFNPAWNRLAWSPAFPAMMLRLLYPNEVPMADELDQRVLAPGQVLPAENRDSLQSVASSRIINLHALFWWALLAVIALERLLSVNNKKSGYG